VQTFLSYLFESEIENKGETGFLKVYPLDNFQAANWVRVISPFVGLNHEIVRDVDLASVTR